MAYGHKVAFRQDGQGVGSPFQVTKLNLEHARSQDLDNNTHLPPLKRLLGHIANQRNHVQQVRYACEDIALLRRRLRALEGDIARCLMQHEVGKLLATIDGIGSQTAACIMGEVGDPARFHSLGALASYVEVIPRLRESGKRKKTRTAHPLALGNARLRRALWMPILSAVRVNP